MRMTDVTRIPNHFDVVKLSVVLQVEARKRQEGTLDVLCSISDRPFLFFFLFIYAAADVAEQSKTRLNWGLFSSGALQDDCLSVLEL